MELNRDFTEFVELLNKHKVEYMVVGAYALAFHGNPRQTGDIDIWIQNSGTNAEKMVQVLSDFGMGSLRLRKEDFVKEGNIVQIGYAPFRIDILTDIDGVEFKEAMDNQVQPRRVLLAFWKNRQENQFEVFTNLKLFCQSYPGYSYNTLSNYLSKAKIPYENEAVRIERKDLLTRPLSSPVKPLFRMERTVHIVNRATHDEKAEDLAYWLTKEPSERVMAVTFLVAQLLPADQQMDRTFVKQRNQKDDAII